MPGVVAGPLPNSISGDGWPYSKMEEKSPYMAHMISPRDSILPPWRGTGYIAGEAPDGLVTFNGDGAVRTLDLFDRETSSYIMSTVSASDGTYRFSGLSLARLFDVRARGSSDTENDVIASQITAKAEGLSINGTLPDVTRTVPYSASLLITGGIGVYSNLRLSAGALPSGISMSLSGNSIQLSGTTTVAPSSFNPQFAVDSGSETATSLQSISVINAPDVFNAADKGPNITLSNNNYTMVRTGSGYVNTQIARSVRSHNAGKYYFEFTANRDSNNWSSLMGFCDGTLPTTLVDTTVYPSLCTFRPSNGTPTNTASNIVNGTSTSISPAQNFASGAVVSVAIDIDAGKYWMQINGQYVQGATVGVTADPASGTNPTGTFTPGMTTYIVAESVFQSTEITLNTGQSAFVYQPPSGFKKW